jgi:TM2 domain-containing membrane protein YozV
MNCANHPEAPVSAFCRECGKPMCQDCQRLALGSVYCAEHVPATVPATAAAQPPSPEPSGAAPYTATPYATSYSAPYPAPPVPPSPYTAPAPAPVKMCDTNSHPLLAFLLGFIPGVGALYNGQLAKGLIHAVVFGLLVSLASNSHSNLEPLLGMMIAAWVFYMAFEAWHTAKKRRDGDSVEEFSSLFDIRPTHGRFPAGAVLLIAVGFLLLLDTTDMIDMVQLDRYWPVGLIVLGLYMLYTRLTGDRSERQNNNAEARR